MLFRSAVIGEETSRRSGAISRVLSSLGFTLESICHLSGIGVTTYLGAIYPPAGASNPRCAGIHDLATHKVYGSLYRYRLGELLPHLFTITTGALAPVAVILCYIYLPSRIASR